MGNMNMSKLADAACLHRDKIHNIEKSLAEIQKMMQNAGQWADTLAVEELPAPGFGVLVYPDGFAKDNESAVLRQDICAVFSGEVLEESERLVGGDNLPEKIAGEKYVSVPKVVGGKEQEKCS